MVSVVFQNTAKPPAGLSLLGEIRSVAGVKHVIVFLSFESPSSFALNWVNKVS